VLFVVALAYAGIGSIATFLLGRPLIGLNFAQLRKEADYRYKLINIRDSAESIAFYGNERKEYTKTRQRLRAALQNLGLVINWNRNLQFFTTGYNYVLAVLPTVIVAPLFFDGKIEFGAVIQAGVAFGFVLNALSIVVNHFGNISVFAAVINRLGTFLEAIDRSKKSAKVGEGIVTEVGPRVEFHNVTIFTPNRDQMLVNGLTFQLDKRSLLLCGPSGSGKTSVLRAVAGLWSAGHGRIVRPPLSETFFVPQRPYMVLGTLRSQLLYGARRSGFIDSQLIKVVELVGLDEMLERVGGLDAFFDWPNVLGTGEQQRLAFARVFLARPKIVFLDEATTAVDRNMEQRLYTMLLDHVQFFVSTGNRLTLGEFHDRVLELQPDGRWSTV
jgi:putative ATP-binding cassette transporter